MARVPINHRAKRRIEQLARQGHADFRRDVREALEYAMGLLSGVGVKYIRSPLDSGNCDLPHGIEYVDRGDWRLETVAYDWTEEKFLWRFRIPYEQRLLG